MTRFALAGMIAASVVGAAGVALAMPPIKALAGISGGLWEVDGVPGHKAAVKSCVASPVQLSFAEHVKAKCTPTILGDTPPSVKLSYQCTGGGFGQATIKALTPRSLRIDVQGIADGAPYAYVMQARRVGECSDPGQSKQPERGH